MILFSLFWSAITFAVSLLLNPFVYREDASEWGSKRAAPAIGTALGFMAIYGNLWALRRRGKDSAEGDMLAILAAFVSVGSAVVAADLFRRIKEIAEEVDY